MKTSINQKNNWIYGLLTLQVLFLFSCKKDDKIVLEAPIRPITTESKAYVSTLFEFMPAPGQFINTSIADSTAAKGLLGKKGFVSLGSFGGYITLGFDHTVINGDGEDIVVYGNAIANFAEPGVIWVMEDLNGNGKPDDIWYELSGSETDSVGYLRNYSITYKRPAAATDDVTWIDSKGKSGSVKTNTFHKQAYYPLAVIADTYTLKGTLLPTRNIDDSNPSNIKSVAFAFGYADNTPNGDKVDISNAVDENGKKVSLKGVDFIKIQNGIPYNMGWLGELSTEVSGIADLSLIK